MRKEFLLVMMVGTALMGQVSADESSNPNQIFTQANQFFEKGNMQKAEEIYQSLISQGFESAELYYNLGNIQYRKGSRGKAILWYERAARLAPRDSDIQFNLSLARSHIKNEDSNFIRKIVLYATNNELSWVLLVLVWIFFGTLGGSILGWIKNETGLGVTLWLSGLLLLIAGGWFGVNVAMAREPLAIVINPPGEVRNGPGPDYAVGFTIPEGSKVLVLSARPEWTQVGVPSQGLKGWMPNLDVQTIIPSPSFSN